MLVQEPSKSIVDATGARLWANSYGERPAGLADLAALRLVLTGESVVDLPRLWFSSRDEVDHFIRLLQFDTDNPLDLNQIWELHEEAVLYLTERHGYQLPRSVEEPEEIHQLFLDAALARARQRRYACMVLKTMHIMNHINGRELIFKTAISEAQLLEILSNRIFNTIDQMRAAGVAVQEFAAGQKSRTSMVTKLLAKRSNLAAHIFDKVRFRIVVDDIGDVVRGLTYLLHHLVPFNYVVPEQSQNGIVTVAHIASALNMPVELVQRYWSGEIFDPAAPFLPQEAGACPNPPNEFSGRTYRCVNFVADIPLRIDELAPDGTPAIIFVQAEIQLVDAVTHVANNMGENAHDLYKERQLSRVRRRLGSDEDDPINMP